MASPAPQAGDDGAILQTTDFENMLHTLWNYLLDPEHLKPTTAHYWYEKRKRVLKLLRNNPAPISMFVELGCGSGVDLFLIRPVVQTPGSGVKMIGLDGDSFAVKTCRAKAAYYGVSDVSIEQHDLLTPLPFQNETVDAIYCSEVLEHLLEPHRFLGEVARVLKPQGYFLVTTPNEPNVFQRSFWSPQRRARNRQALLEKPDLINGGAFANYGHISIHTIGEWEAMFRQHGLILRAAERGALFYAAPRQFLFSLQILTEWLLDLFPAVWTRRLSDQLIGLYVKKS